MILFAVILLGVCVISGVVIIWMELSITNDRLQWLEERLTRLEKDAVKVTFTPPFTNGDEKVIVHPQVKTNPKVLGEWQTKNGSPFKKSNPKQFDGVKSEEPFIKTRTKRKPKTTKEWEDEFDLGGHE
jgi:hypothetical protein